MAYLNKIDINGRTYYLQHLTDGKYEAKLPELEKNATLIVQDYNSYSGNVGDSDTPIYIEKNKIKPMSSKIGSEYQFIYMKSGSLTASTSTIGSNTKPVYMREGIITEISNTIGSTTQPIYINEGEITVSDATVGSGIKPIYMKDGVVTASTSTVGDVAKPIYIKDGTITELNANIGTSTNPVYMSEGVITKSNATVGSGVKLVYMNNGEIIESKATVGSGTKLIYMNGGEITDSNETVGSAVKPIYMNKGTIAASTSTVGTINQPIYMNAGEITVCSDNVGGNGVPVYMKNGVITACGTLPISSGGTGATTATKALENFGLTATAAELNTLDGITATVTDLNHVKGVTSSIQGQFNDHEDRIDTIEAFFKEADIDASKEFIDTLKEIQTYITDDKTGAAKMALSIKGNTDAITKLNGDANTAGSVAKAVADAQTALNTEISKKVDKVTNMGLYPDADKQKLAGIEDGANKYTHPDHSSAASGLYKITVNELGHVSGVEVVEKEDITNLGIPGQDTTYGVTVANTETENGVDGLLSAADKAKYDKYESTIAGLLKRIEDLEKLVKDYHPTTDPEEPTEPEEPVEPDETE